MIDYNVRLVDRVTVRDFIEEHHYSHSINGLMSTYCFGMFDKDDVLVGAMIYGRFAMANVWRKYGSSPESVIELRRLVLVDDTPRNAESYFIGATLRWLKRNTSVQTVVSYADPNYGHSGVIYRATNFVHVGMTQPGKVVMWNGKKFHDKAIRTKYNGKLKPFALELRKALERGDAYYVRQEPKHIYQLELNKRRQRELRERHGG